MSEWSSGAGMGGGTAKRTISVGGLGGSGTRVFANLLRGCGFYLGSDLNAALDNLWFTLIFTRRSILLEPPEALADLLDLFVRRMTGGDVSGHPALERVVRLADTGRLLHEADWLSQRLKALQAPDQIPHNADVPWGWKAPNTHVVVDRLLTVMPNLHYIHVVRDPYYMAFSANRNQLSIWGGVFLDRDVRMRPDDALAYWCAANVRMERIQARFPGRVMFASYDRLCLSPRDEIGRIVDFVLPGTPTDMAAELQGVVSMERLTRPSPEHLDFPFDGRLRKTAEDFCSRHFAPNGDRSTSAVLGGSS